MSAVYIESELRRLRTNLRDFETEYASLEGFAQRWGTDIHDDRLEQLE